MDSTVLNNNVHVHDIVHWEIWKNNQSISNMEVIDNNVQFFFLINSPTYYFIQINIKKKCRATNGPGLKIANLFAPLGIFY